MALFSLLLFSFTLLGKDITYTVNGEKYEGYFVKAKRKAPFILLIHDWDGVTEYEKKRAKMLKKLGYTVFAADLFGKGVRPTETAEKRKLTGALYNDREKMRTLIAEAIKVAKAQGANIDNGAVMGYCFGGTATLEYARSGSPMKAFISFHGGLKTPEGQDYKNTKGKVAVFHGTADAAVKMEDFAALANELETEKVYHEMITYSGAPHAFSVFGSPRYRKDADEKSWKRFTEFLKESL